MIVRKLDDIRASDRNVESDGWVSARLLLKDDGMGFSFHPLKDASTGRQTGLLR